MDSNVKRWSPERIVILAALAFGSPPGRTGSRTRRAARARTARPPRASPRSSLASGQAAAPSGGQPGAGSGATRRR